MLKILKRKKQEKIKVPSYLTKKEQHQIQSIIENARNDDGVPRTAQQSIPF